MLNSTIHSFDAIYSKIRSRISFQFGWSVRNFHKNSITPIDLIGIKIILYFTVGMRLIWFERKTHYTKFFELQI